MTNEDALYDVIEAKITAAVDDRDVFFEVNLFSSTRGNAADADKTIRLEVMDGLLSPTEEAELKEQNTAFVIECLVKTSGVSLADEQAAQAVADTLGKAVFSTLIENPNLDGAVCDTDFFTRNKSFERGIINLGANRYGAFYLEGVINAIRE